MRFFAVSITGAMLLAGCNTEQAPSAIETLGARAAIDSLWAGYARAADQKDPAAFGALFAESAALVYSNAPTVRGRDSIQVFLTRLYADVDLTGFRIEPDETQVAGSTAIESGTFEERFIDKGAEMTEYGRFMLTATREKDGSWKFHRLVAIADSTVASR